METILRTIEKIIPSPIYNFFQPAYHFTLSFVGALIYRFPSRHIRVVGITGTKGKSSTTELTASILEEAGHRVASASTIQFKINGKEERNLFKMTMPGRFFLQRFLRQAVNSGCRYAVIEMSSEGAKFWRHRFVSMDALIFLNLSPEHIESHGSYEKYVAAKVRLADQVARSRKPWTAIIVNGDDKESEHFIKRKAHVKKIFTLKDAEPWSVSNSGISLTYRNTPIKSKLRGTFNVSNILAAATYATTQNISPEVIAKGIEKVERIKGRVDFVTLKKDHPLAKLQNFDIVVDYAHTTDSLEKLYQAFPEQRIIAVLGNTGGGRDRWKRPDMAKVADRYAEQIILTNEDPYEEDPLSIVNEMAVAIKDKPLRIIMDRREAIHEAISWARPGDVVLITGKGTDPYIMEANGKRTPWSDEEVAREELIKCLSSQK